MSEIKYPKLHYGKYTITPMGINSTIKVFVQPVPEGYALIDCKTFEHIVESEQSVMRMHPQYVGTAP